MLELSLYVKRLNKIIENYSPSCCSRTDRCLPGVFRPYRPETGQPVYWGAAFLAPDSGPGWDRPRHRRHCRLSGWDQGLFQYTFWRLHVWDIRFGGYMFGIRRFFRCIFLMFVKMFGVIVIIVGYLSGIRDLLEILFKGYLDGIRNFLYILV